MRKVVSSACALILSVASAASFIACDKGGDKPWGDKIRIDVSLYSGGYGTDWFVELANKYNASQDKYYINKLPDNKSVLKIAS